jgi:hypothetical protein
MARAPAKPRAPEHLAGLQRLRDARVRPPRNLSLAPDMDRAIREAASQRRSTGGCADAWSRIIPPALLAKTSLEGVSKGVLTVRVPDASTRFELDRFLRSGGQKQLVSACRANLSRVRLVVAATPPDGRM